MKICYFDESGTGSEPVAVIVGVIVDTHRMHVTKDDWAALLTHLSEIVGKELKELHTCDFYPGNGPFRALIGQQRADYISAILNWFSDRKHQFVYSAIDKKLFSASQEKKAIPEELQTVWRAMAFHAVLSVQRAHQALEKTKGHTLLVFDEKHEEEKPFISLLLDPPEWSGDYYGRSPKEPPLQHIIDAPYFADSKHVALLQVADFISYFLRRHAEISEGHTELKYPEERARVEEWIKMLSDRCVGSQHIYPAKGRTKVAELFFQHCPASLQRIGG